MEEVTGTGPIPSPPSRGDARLALVDPATRQFRSLVLRCDLTLSVIPHLPELLGWQQCSIAIVTVALLIFL